MHANFDTTLHGHKVNEETSTETSPEVVLTKKRFDVLGKKDELPPDPSSEAHVDIALFVTAAGHAHRDLDVFDTDGTPNLTITVTNAGDVIITNPGDVGSSTYTLKRVLPHQLAIEEARRKVAEAGPSIEHIKVENGRDGSAYGGIEVEGA